MKTTTFFYALLLSFVLFACGSKTSENTSTDSEATTASETAKEAVDEMLKEAGAYEMLANSEENPCEVLTMEMVKEVMNPTGEITKDDSYGCTYTWDRPNKAEIEEARSKAPIKDFMKYKSEFSVDFSVSKAGGYTADNFIPKKMTAAQQEKIKEQTMASVDDKLTDEQKEIGEDFAEKMLKKVGEAEYTPVDGVGDAAYWNPLGGGYLMILAGDKVISLGAFVDEDFDKNLEKAKQLAQKVLK